MYKYYGAPAVAFWGDGLAGCHSNDGEASQAPDDSAAQVVQAVTCEVCKMQFINLDHLRSHETRNKHKKNLRIFQLKTRTMSNAVPKVVQVVNCEVCKIKCTTLDGVWIHETGKKHKKNLEKLQESITSEPAKPPNGAVGASTESAAASVVADGVIPAVQPKKNKRSPANPEDLEVKNSRVLEAGAAQGELKTCTMSNVVKKIPKVVQLVTCEVCKMQFNNLYNLRGHETGKKHKKNLEKLQDSTTPEPAKPPNDAVGASTEPAAVADGVTPAVQPKKNKRPASTPEDLEAKRRRVVEHGTAEGEVKICTTCNVVTSCQKDYEVHIAGRNHNAKLQRQQRCLEASLDPAKVVQPVTCEVCKMLSRKKKNVCKVQFNNLYDLRRHETGNKHKKNLEKLQDSTTPEPAKPPNDAVEASTEPAAAAAVADTVMPAVQPKKNESSTATPEDLEVKKRRVLEAGAAQGELETCTMSNAVKKIPKVVQPVTCEVCKMQFYSLNSLRAHVTGKKHKKNLEKLQDSITPEPAKPPNDAVGASTEPAAVADGVTPAVQPKKNKRPASTPEDLEAKRRRVMEHGAAEGEVKICTTCNVVANCQKDYEVHIAGHNHNAKLQRQ